MGDWRRTRMRSRACVAEYEVLDRFNTERRFEPVAYARRGGPLPAARRHRALADAARSRRWPSGSEVRRDPGRGDRGERRERRAPVGLVEGRAAVVTAGAWAPQLVDLADVVVTARRPHFASTEPMPALIDTTVDGDPRLRAGGTPCGGVKAGIHKTGPPASPDRPAMPDYDVADAAAVARPPRARISVRATSASRRASTRTRRTSSSCSRGGAGSWSARRAAATASSSHR